MNVLEVKDLSKSFDHIYALRDINFELREGEILGILGPNGAGKTTLIHLLLGLILPTSGEIHILGKDMKKNRIEILSRINFASNYVSLPYMLTPWENLFVYAYMYGVENPARRCEETLKLFGLYDLRNKMSRTLSSGQLMRLSLAKAMINRPKLLLLDEPTAGLDPEIARHTRELLKHLAGEKKLSVLYTSHNLYEMQQVSDRVMFLKKGRIMVRGTSRELLGKYQVENLEELFFKVLESE